MFVEFQRLTLRPGDTMHEGHFPGPTLLLHAGRLAGFESSDAVLMRDKSYVPCCYVLYGNDHRALAAGTAVDNAERCASAMFIWERNVRIAAGAFDEESVPTPLDRMTDDEVIESARRARGD